MLLKRWSHGASLLQNDQIVMFGGYGGTHSHQRLNDTITINLSTNEIQQQSKLKGPENSLPGPMMGHTLNTISSLIQILI